MKVITSGNQNKPKWWLTTQLTCDLCGCVFMLEDGDNFDHLDDRRNTSTIIADCPECGTPTPKSEPHS